MKIKRILKFRIDDHRGCVNNSINTATGPHFNLPGHFLGNMKIAAIEQIKKKMTMNTEKNVKTIL